MYVEICRSASIVVKGVAPVRQQFQSLVIACFVFTFVVVGSQPASAAPTPSESEVRQFVAQLMAMAEHGSIAQLADGQDWLTKPFEAWVRSKPHVILVGIRHMPLRAGRWAVLCVEEQGERRRVITLLIDRKSTGGSLMLAHFTPSAWYARSKGVFLDAVDADLVWSWHNTLTGGTSVTVHPYRGDATSVAASSAPPLQELEDHVELLKALLGENPTPSPRVMTRIVWNDSSVQRVVRGIQGTILAHQGDYLDDSRQQFLLSVLTDSGNGHLLVTDLHFQRSSGHWTKAEPFVSQGTMLCPIAHFVGFHTREGAYLGPMDPKLVKELLTVVLGADGTYAARVQPRGLRTANGSPVCPTDPTQFHSLAAALRRAASQLSVGAQAISADRAVLSVNTETQLVVCDFVRTKTGWVLRDWAAFPPDQYAQRYAGRMATMPVEALGSIATLTKRQQLTAVAATPLGQLLTRFFRMLGVNNRREVSNYLANDLVNRVYDASWWSAELLPLAELDPADITLELSGSGALIVEAGTYRLTGTFKNNELTLRPAVPGATSSASLPGLGQSVTLDQIARTPFGRSFAEFLELVRKDDSLEAARKFLHPRLRDDGGGFPGMSWSLLHFHFVSAAKSDRDIKIINNGDTYAVTFAGGGGLLILIKNDGSFTIVDIVR